MFVQVHRGLLRAHDRLRGTHLLFTLLHPRGDMTAEIGNLGVTCLHYLRYSATRYPLPATLI